MPIARTIAEEEKSTSLLKAVIISLIIITVGSYAEYQYRIQNKFLIEEYRNLTVAIYVTLSLFALGCMMEYKHGSRTDNFKLRIIRRFTPLLGILVVALLLTLLLSFLGTAAGILWALFMLDALIKTVKETLEFWRQWQYGDTTTEENRATAGEGNELLAERI